MGRVVRAVAARFPLGATVLAVGPHAVEGPGTGPIPYDRLAGAMVRHHGVRLPPPMGVGGAIGQRVGRGIGRGAGLDAHRTVVLQPLGATAVACDVGAFADDAGFARVVHALSWELARRGLRLDDPPD